MIDMQGPALEGLSVQDWGRNANPSRVPAEDLFMIKLLV